MSKTSEKSFETIIESHLLENGYLCIPKDGVDRGPTIFPDQVLAFIRATQNRKLPTVHNDEWNND